MASVGTFEAKTRFSALLERVAQGEEIVITRHGRPVARLVPPAASEDVDQAIAALKRFRQGATLGGLSWKELRDAGRR